MAADLALLGSLNQYVDEYRNSCEQVRLMGELQPGVKAPEVHTVAHGESPYTRPVNKKTKHKRGNPFPTTA